MVLPVLLGVLPFELWLSLWVEGSKCRCSGVLELELGRVVWVLERCMMARETVLWFRVQAVEEWMEAFFFERG